MLEIKSYFSSIYILAKSNKCKNIKICVAKERSSMTWLVVGLDASHKNIMVLHKILSELDSYRVHWNYSLIAI